MIEEHTCSIRSGSRSAPSFKTPTHASKKRGMKLQSSIPLLISPPGSYPKHATKTSKSRYVTPTPPKCLKGSDNTYGINSSIKSRDNSAIKLHIQSHPIIEELVWIVTFVFTFRFTKDTQHCESPGPDVQQGLYQVMLIILLTSILVPMKGRNSCERETIGNPSQSLCEIKVVVVSAPQAAAAGRHRWNLQHCLVPAKIPNKWRTFTDMNQVQSIG